MKIEIEWECSYKAKMKIDGKELTVVLKPGETSLEGISEIEIDSTIGGIIAGDLYGRIANFMQAEAVMFEKTGWDPEPESTWREMDEDDYRDVLERASF